MRKRVTPPEKAGPWLVQYGIDAPRAPTRLPLSLDSVYYKEATPAYQVEAHSHPVAQWFVCVHGGMDIAIEGVRHQLKPGETIFVAPGSRRECWARGRAPGYLCAMFAPDAIDLSQVMARPLALPSALRDDLTALIAELRAPTRPESPHLIVALLARLIIGQKLAASAPPPRAAPLNTAKEHAAVAKAEAHMRENLHRPLARAEVAASVGVTEAHLARLFRAATGGGVNKRLTEMRIVRAKELLAESALPVTAIAGQVGFSSFSHFSLLFRRAVGLSPSDYRRSGGVGGR